MELNWEYWAAFAFIVSSTIIILLIYHWLLKAQERAENLAKAKEEFQREIDDLDNCHKENNI